MKSKKAFSAHRASLVLFVLVILTLLAVVALGTYLYAQLTQEQTHSEQARATLSYLCAQVQASDGAAIIAGPQGDALVLKESTEEKGDAAEYETRIYCYDGWLLEEYTVSALEFSPETAQKIARTDTFFVQAENNQLLTFETDSGQMSAAVRSESGVA